MTQGRTQGQFASLQQIYADVIGNMRSDPLERILVISYEFDEQQLVNLVAARSLNDEFELRKNHLRFVADLEPVVIYDARKTKEFTQLPHFLELLPIRCKPYSCHHSKAYLIITQKTVRLVIGSFNLTQTGLFSNREVFAEFFWNDSEKDDLAVLASFMQLLQAGYADKAHAAASASLTSIIETLKFRLQAWGPGKTGRGYALLASGYTYRDSANGMEELAAQWQRVSAAPPVRVFAVSPFFDHGKSYLADELARALGTFAALHLVTEEGNIGALSKRHFGKAPSRKLSLVRKLADERERARIAAANDGMQITDLQIERKLHAKLLLLCGPDQRHLLYIGSANFTDKAWNGDNYELGLTWIEQGDADALVKRILDALAVVIDNAYDRLPEERVSGDLEDDEEYSDEPGYPDFIERIELVALPKLESIQFLFQAQQPGLFETYDIQWGGLALAVTNGHSQVLPIDQIYTRLLGGKNLTFSPRPRPDIRFNIPFSHAPDLVRQQDLFLFPEPEDWLKYYLNPGRSNTTGGVEFLPGEPPDDGQDAASEVDRDGNVVIAMQRYLTLFSGVEKEFSRRADDIAALPTLGEQQAACAKRIEAPLRAFADLLVKRRGQATAPNDRLTYGFQMGELALFCHRLSLRIPALQPLVQSLAEKLQALTGSGEVALHTYLTYCQQRILDDQTALV